MFTNINSVTMPKTSISSFHHERMTPDIIQPLPSISFVTLVVFLLLRFTKPNGESRYFGDNRFYSQQIVCACLNIQTIHLAWCELCWICIIWNKWSIANNLPHISTTIDWLKRWYCYTWLYVLLIAQKRIHARINM